MRYRAKLVKAVKHNNKICEYYRKKQILIPGGAGFIGSNLAKRLVKCEAKVTIVDSFDALCGANIFNIKGIKNRVRLEKKKIEKYLAENNLDKYNIIFNCIGLTNHYIGNSRPGVDREINYLSGLRLLEKLANEKSGCRMISIGSRSQYGRPRSMIVDESCRMNPLDVQSIHKVKLERCHDSYAAKYGLDLSFMRLTNVYGPGQRLRGDGIGAIGEIIKNSVSGNEVVIYGSMTRIKDILFIDDVVEALLLLGMEEKPGFAVYNLGGQPCRLSKLINAVKRNVKVGVKVLPFPKRVKKIDTGDVVLDTGRFMRATGWTPQTGINEGITSTLGYYRRRKKYYLEG